MDVTHLWRVTHRTYDAFQEKSFLREAAENARESTVGYCTKFGIFRCFRYNLSEFVIHFQVF